MLGLCKNHNEPEDVLVSQKIKKIINQKICLSDYTFSHIIVRTVDGGKQTGVYHYYLEEEDMQNIGLPLESPIELWDRDKEFKSINDRVVCLKIKRLVVGVCEVCFSSLNFCRKGS